MARIAAWPVRDGLLLDAIAMLLASSRASSRTGSLLQPFHGTG